MSENFKKQADPRPTQFDVDIDAPPITDPGYVALDNKYFELEANVSFLGDPIPKKLTEKQITALRETKLALEPFLSEILTYTSEQTDVNILEELKLLHFTVIKLLERINTNLSLVDSSVAEDEFLN